MTADRRWTISAAAAAAAVSIQGSLFLPTPQPSVYIHRESSKKWDYLLFLSSSLSSTQIKIGNRETIRLAPSAIALVCVLLKRGSMDEASSSSLCVLLDRSRHLL